MKEQNLALTAEKQSDPGKKLGLVDHKNLHFSFFHGLRRIELKDGKHQKLDRQALLPTELLLFGEKSDAGGGALEYAPYQHQVSARMISKIRGAF